MSAFAEASRPRLEHPGEQQEQLPALARPLVRLIAFAALALYGVIRWAGLLTPAPGGRLTALLALSLLLGTFGPLLRRRGRAPLVLASIAAVLVAFPLAGVPLGWMVHARIGLMVDGIGHGLGSLPRVLVPYNGLDQWTRIVIVLGAAVLLLDAALVLAFAPRSLGDLRRATAALPLIALAVIPSTIARPKLPYVQGLVLFALLGFFIWGEHLRRGQTGAALALGALAAAGGLIAAPRLEQHRPWINYQALGGAESAAQVDSFDWSQHYGPLSWPRVGRDVIEVQAARPAYWKAEDLDLFDGRGWTAWSVESGSGLPSPDPTALNEWTQTLKVTIRDMKTTYLIAAGYASQPTNVPGEVLRGLSPGTWTSDADLGPGDSYLVQAYTPNPTPAELSSAGEEYPADALQGYLTLTVPQLGDLPDQQVAFAPFGSASTPQNVSDVAVISGADAITHSPYARALTLAKRLASQAVTPYAYVMSVEHYLLTGYRYDENPAVGRYPLASFLFTDKAGYCQQFAGAMALLLRMGGIPARVATGFTSGTYDQAAHSWVASDLDAHAWVEAWFPHYGWVEFDPTPAADPARGGRPPVAALGAVRSGTSEPRQLPHRAVGASPRSASPRPRPGSSAPVGAIVGGLLGVLGLGALALTARRLLTRPRSDQLLAELERAFARSGHPISTGITLAALEYRLRSSPEAAAYVRAIRMQRFAGGGDAPTARQRRALRTALSSGLGPVGVVRALWALPPWRQ